MSMKIILITGGAGFIGSNLCNRLIKNNKIICLDNFFTGNINNIKHLLVNKNFILIEHDIINSIDIDGPIDEIYHLACPASPPKYQLDPIYTSKISFIGTLNVLELALKKKSTVLFTSTSEIYGEPLETPQNENYRGNVNTIGVRSCYDEGKRIAETLMTDYHLKYGLNIRIARVFNTYGPNMDKDDGRVVTNFIKQMITNDNITVYGDGTQTRSFCYITDLLDGLIKLMGSNYTKPINLGNNEEITILQLKNKLLSLINTKSEVMFNKLPNDDPTNRNPALTLAKNILNWQPSTDLDKGLLNTIEYLKASI